MNVLIESGAYRMDNVGDVAMLQVCLARLRDRWPDARLRVMTETPDRLLAACPDVEPLAPARWHATQAVPGKLRFRGSLRFERRAQLHLPALAYLGKRRQTRFTREQQEGIERFYEAVRGADAAVSSGGGFLTDWHVEHGDKVLHTLGMVQAFGRPTAMFGAGLGPLTDRMVRALARPVLRRLDVLALREETANHALLAELGVRADRRVVVTGDDAIEPAWASRPSSIGDAIGVCVRLAPASRVPREHLAGLAHALHVVGDQLGAPLRAAPVRTALSPDNDVESLRSTFGEVPIALADAECVRTPADLIAIVGRCRVMVTGAYHAGVFALAQGIPVVALSGSTYYDHKFEGLRELFGVGVTILRYDEPALAERIGTAVHERWRGAPRMRDALLLAAERQVVRSRAAYGRFVEIVERRANGRAVEGRPRAPARQPARG